ncbi:Uncharacterised protein [Mycobacteroides abscessus subsp. abscessus]|nr:Uncharacterised protein [Mycobacteroides abscessus subsp. abscessus]
MMARANSVDSVNTYSANGFGPALTWRMAASSESTGTTGRMGPKISCVMTGSSVPGPTMTVGSMCNVERSELPPATTVPVVEPMSPASRSNWRSLTIRCEAVRSPARKRSMFSTIFVTSASATARSAST